MIEPEFYEILYWVEGAGTFPLDMLRYDSACPATEQDTWTIGYDERRTVALRRFAKEPRKGPQVARWTSFGWRVVGVTYADGTKTTHDEPKEH